jgi:hypothetical protein
MTSVGYAKDASIGLKTVANPLWTAYVMVGAHPARVRQHIRRVELMTIEVKCPLEINGSYLKWDTWQRSTVGGTGATDAGRVCRRSDKHVCRSRFSAQ